MALTETIIALVFLIVVIYVIINLKQNNSKQNLD
jgi:uncharacterized protein YoxC